MTSLDDSKNIYIFITTFLEKHGSDKMLEMWNDPSNMQAFNKVLIDTVKHNMSKKKESKKEKESKKDSKKDSSKKKPKRAKSAYIYFCSDKRANVKDKNDNIKASEIKALLGEMWKDLKNDEDRSHEMEKYTKLADDDKARYNEEIKHCIASSDNEFLVAKKGSKKDPNAPKRNNTAYIYFCSNRRPDAKSKLGDNVKATEVTKLLGKMWKELKEDDDRSDEMEMYTNLAAYDKARYVSENQTKKARKKKSDNVNKKGKSAYIYFCSDKRADVKNELGKDAKTTDVTALLCKMWKELKEDDDRSDEMEKYTKMAVEDKSRYEEEIKKVVDSTDDKDKPVVKKSKKIVDDTKPAKCKTGYTYFCQSNRDSVKHDNPEMKATEVTKELTRLWKELSDEDKQEWIDSTKRI